MSYEGYYQLLCKEGHNWEEDCYVFDMVDSKCPICKGKVIWYNGVDITNGSYDDKGKRIDGYIELKKISETKCKECKSILEQVYKIPKDKKIKGRRTKSG